MMLLARGCLWSYDVSSLRTELGQSEDRISSNMPGPSTRWRTSTARASRADDGDA
jgi:hypothetical protein